MIRVLYVDDEDILLDIGKAFLEKSGDLQVDTFTSVQAAKKALAQMKYDAIISDYQMPEKDGIQFLKELRENKETTPFILFTGKGREEVVIEALNNGADFYIQKGVAIQFLNSPSLSMRSRNPSINGSAKRNLPSQASSWKPPRTWRT